MFAKFVVLMMFGLKVIEMNDKEQYGCKMKTLYIKKIPF